MKSALQSLLWRSKMADQNPITTLPWRSWLNQILRWILGGIAGIVVSAWFYFGLKNDATTGSFFWFRGILESPLAVPFVGHISLFYPYPMSFPQISNFFATPPVLFWGLIGLLLASGRSVQLRIGITLLVIYVIVGCILFFQAIMQIPT